MSLSIFFYNKKLILITKKIFYNKKIIILFCFDGLLILMWLSHIFAQWYVFAALARYLHQNRFPGRSLCYIGDIAFVDYYSAQNNHVAR
jgi:hypothetical protein